MLRINELRVPVSHSEADIKKKIEKILNTQKSFDYSIVKRSLDCRHKPEIIYSYVVDVKIDNEDSVLKKCSKNVTKVSLTDYKFPYVSLSDELSEKPVIIGMGPAGLFAGLYLSRNGFKPVIYERGLSVDERTKSVEAFFNGEDLAVNNNVQFGEGGAGTFSDGKLNTQVKDKTGRIKAVLKDFINAGANPDILYDNKPHIGTDVLSKVVKNIRNEIIQNGGEVHFDSCVTDFVIKDNVLKSIVINDKEEVFSNCFVLAIGHSARDTFFRLHERGIKMEPKPFAVGLRVSHKASIINNYVYGLDYNENLGNQSYKVTHTCKDGNGVYSFCMCPGGYVVNASSEENHLCVNGMSYSGRDSEYSNSAIIITVSPNDYGGTMDEPLKGVEFQRRLEKKAYDLGDGSIPVESYGEFKNRQLDEDSVLEVCSKGNCKKASLHNLFEEYMYNDFVEGMEAFGNIISGFNNDNTVLYGVESRTSSPVKMPRNDSMQSNISNLYVCGEGAGYAGGIMSAAVDGIKIAEAIYANEIKKRIRLDFISNRNNLDLEYRKNASDIIKNKILLNDRIIKTNDILIYSSYKSEVDTTYIIESLLDNKNIYCPKVCGDEIVFYKINSLSDLKAGYQGILEPDVTNLAIFSDNIENAVCITPGCCFDISKNRLGYGKGFYDRFFNVHPNVYRIGICFKSQVYDDIIPCSINDIKMNEIITD